MSSVHPSVPKEQSDSGPRCALSRDVLGSAVACPVWNSLN